MYIDVVPNRKSPPAVLLRESFREGKKVRKRTLANLSKLPREVVDGLRVLLRGGTAIEELSDAFEVIESQPYGHVAAVLGTLRKLGLDRLLAAQASQERQLVVAMIVARVLEPASKLATARGLDADGPLSALAQELHLGAVDENQLYAALDWLWLRQAKIETRLAERHLEQGSLVLYDVTSTYFEGRTCPLAQFGHGRDEKKGKLQIVFGLLCNRQGCPIAVEVFSGETADPKTLAPQIEKVRERFGLERVVWVGDRGMLTSARIDEELRGIEGLDWISALRSSQIRKLFAEPGFQFSLFDERDMVELESPEFPGERLIVCRNPLLAEERARKREALLKATEEKLDAVVAATGRQKGPLRGKDRIGLRVGKVINHYKVGGLFVLEITETAFHYRRNEARIADQAALDGFYVIRTSVPEEQLGAEEAVRCYKRLSVVERAFRSFKSVDLKVRPIHHQLRERVEAHVFLCMLAYYVEWHLRQTLAPVLFDDSEPEIAEGRRTSIVAPAQRSPSALRKAQSKKTPDGLPVHSFQTLMKNLATLTRNRIQPTLLRTPSFQTLTRPSPLQQKALSLLGVTLRV